MMFLGLAVAQASLPPFDDVPGVVIERYDVAGRTPSAIRRSINALRPTDPNDGERVDGTTRFDWRWRWLRDPGGTCTVRPEDVTFSAVVTLPRLADPAVPERVRQAFDRYLAALLAHEEGHVRLAWNRRDDLVRALDTAACDGIAVAGRAMVERMSAEQVAFDRTTRHGATTIPPFG